MSKHAVHHLFRVGLGCRLAPDEACNFHPELLPDKTTVATKEHLGMTITLQNASWRNEGACGSGDVAPLFLNLVARWGGKPVLPPSKDSPGTHGSGSWVDNIACMDVLEKR